MAKHTWAEMPDYIQNVASKLGCDNSSGISSLITRRKREFDVAQKNLLEVMNRCQHPPERMILNSGVHKDTLGNYKNGWYNLRCGVCDASVKYWET